MLHLISASLHQTNFAIIDQEIKTLSFQELRNPDLDHTNANDLLLAFREVISELTTVAAETGKHAPSHVKQFYESFQDDGLDAMDDLAFYSPIARLTAIEYQANDLHRFLMDSYHLLLGSVSIKKMQDAAAKASVSKMQARAVKDLLTRAADEAEKTYSASGSH